MISVGGIFRWILVPSWGVPVDVSGTCVREGQLRVRESQLRVMGGKSA